MAGKQRAKKGTGKGLNPIKSAILLRLAQGSLNRPELVAELKEQGHDSKATIQTLNDLAKAGLIRMDEGKGKCSLRQDFPTFKTVFGYCTADGKATDFLATTYSKSVLSDDLFPVLTKEFVRSAILSTLQLLTMPPVDRAKNSSLLLLHKTVYSDPNSSAAIQGIAGSLEAIGFSEALKKGLIGLKTTQERESETYTRLEKLAEDYLKRFLGSKTPLPSALMGCQSLLFPEKERAEILEILRSSPFALTFLLANEDRFSRDGHVHRDAVALASTGAHVHALRVIQIVLGHRSRGVHPGQEEKGRQRVQGGRGEAQGRDAAAFAPPAGASLLPHGRDALESKRTRRVERRTSCPI